jgi:hypothetical protein
MKFQRSHQGEHLKSECEYRNVKCDFCGKDVTFASMKVRENEVTFENSLNNPANHVVLCN